MNDLALHPHFSEYHWIYFMYYKPVAGTTNARARPIRWGPLSTDEVVSGPSAAKIVFGSDGKIYMAIAIPIPLSADDRVRVTVSEAQAPNSLYGKSFA
jgi:hypothetical protein